MAHKDKEKREKFLEKLKKKKGKKKSALRKAYEEHN